MKNGKKKTKDFCKKLMVCKKNTKCHENKKELTQSAEHTSDKRKSYKKEDEKE